MNALHSKRLTPPKSFPVKTLHPVPLDSRQYSFYPVCLPKSHFLSHWSQIRKNLIFLLSAPQEGKNPMYLPNHR